MGANEYTVYIEYASIIVQYSKKILKLENPLYKRNPAILKFILKKVKKYFNKLLDNFIAML
jgi:hypothetical protein